MNRIVLISAAAALLGGCGGAPSADTQPAPAVPSGTSGSATIVVTQDGATPPLTQWYVRIETPAAKKVTEAAYPNVPISLTHEVSPGDYRVISWSRPCSGSCPKSGEAGLGAMRDVCGAPVNVGAGARVSTAVEIHSDGTCTVRVDH